MFLENISQAIVENTTKIIGNSISITDHNGYIIGSEDPNRLGSFHKPSLEVMEKRELICYEVDQVKKLENVLPGVAAPIMINNQSIGVLGIVGVPSEVMKYAQLVKSHVELMCHEYLKKEMNDLESKTMDKLIHYLLNSESVEDTETIIRYGKMLGFDLEPEQSRICCLIEIDLLSQKLYKNNKNLSDKANWQFFQDHILELLRYYLVDDKEDMISFLTLDQFILIKKVSEKNDDFIQKLEHKLRRMMKYMKVKFELSIKASIGSISAGIQGIKVSYQDSLKALSAGKKTNKTSDIYLYNDWDIMLELLSNNLNPYISEKLSNNILHFIHHDNYPTLSHTFMTYCKSNMNLSETARTLFLHRNSLVYRLEKIRELTSLDLAKFEHCLLLYFAIKNVKNENMVVGVAK